MRVLITGASRGIGAAVARACAKRWGADVQIGLLARSRTRASHASLEGTLLDTMRDVQALGGTAVPIEVDIRDGSALQEAVWSILHSFGGLDLLVNNAGALVTDPRPSLKNLDVLHAVNTRAPLICLAETAAALESSAGAVVSVSPPIRLGRLDWIHAHPAYTISKYGMTLATLCAASERVRANCLWPRRTIATAATARLERSAQLPNAYSLGRPVDVFAHAVCELASRRDINAQTLFDEELVAYPDNLAPWDAFVDPGQILHHEREQLEPHRRARRPTQVCS
jgi:NAD(P)-dependent dehydrogenase (short-subunit alcohol dehydrogenase family)